MEWIKNPLVQPCGDRQWVAILIEDRYVACSKAQYVDWDDERVTRYCVLDIPAMPTVEDDGGEDE